MQLVSVENEMSDALTETYESPENLFGVFPHRHIAWSEECDWPESLERPLFSRNSQSETTRSTVLVVAPTPSYTTYNNMEIAFRSRRFRSEQF